MFVNLFKILRVTVSDTIPASTDDHLNVKDSWLDLWKCLWSNNID